MSGCTDLIICGMIVILIIGIIFGIESFASIHPSPKEVKTLQTVDCPQLKSHISDLIAQGKYDDEMRAKDLYIWKCDT